MKKPTKWVTIAESKSYSTTCPVTINNSVPIKVYPKMTIKELVGHAFALGLKVEFKMEKMP